MSKSYVGYSLSLCVMDILDGNMRLEDVEAIISNTAARDAYDWDRLVNQYCLTYWKGRAERAQRIVRWLRDANRISQPRLVNPNYSRAIPGGNDRWVAA